MQIEATPKARMQLNGRTHDRVQAPLPPGGGGGRGRRAILLVTFLITVIEHLTAATSGRSGPL